MTARIGDPAQGETRAGWHCGSPKKSGGTCGNRAGKGTDHRAPLMDEAENLAAQGATP